MKKWNFALWLMGATVGSFLCGFVLHLVLTFDPHAGEPRQSELAALRQEASVFFYATMGELFDRTDRTQDSQASRVSGKVLDTFNTYRPRLDPKCWLVDVYPEYSTFFGKVLFPSGDVFEVGMRKDSSGWVLDFLNHMGTGYLFYDLRKAAHDRESRNPGNPGTS